MIQAENCFFSDIIVNIILKDMKTILKTECQINQHMSFTFRKRYFLTGDPSRWN